MQSRFAMYITSDKKRDAFIVHDNGNEIRSVLTGKSVIPVNANYDDFKIKLCALRVEDNEPIRAYEATKADGPFYCPETIEELIIRKCTDKRDHFAYKARLSPVATKESELA